MLTKIQIQNAYLNSGLDSYPNAKWMKLNEQERWQEIEELIKSLYIMYTEFPNLLLPTALQELYLVWQKQIEAFKKLCHEFNLYPIKINKSSENQQIFLNREQKTKEDARQAAEILSCYIKNFGDIEPDRIQYWPSANFIMDRYYYDPEELNGWLNWFCQLPQRRKEPAPKVKPIEMPGLALSA